MRTDRQTDKTKLIVVFANLLKRLKTLALLYTQNLVFPRLAPWPKDYTDLHRSISSRILYRPIVVNSPLLHITTELKFYDKSATGK
jgi:hypothetical protein